MLQDFGKGITTINKLKMKKLILILFSLPIFGFAQNVAYFSKCDLIINQVLENTATYINKRNTPITEFKFYFNNQKPSINWEENKFLKWKITDRNDKKRFQFKIN
jgi:hypothetical protein